MLRSGSIAVGSVVAGVLLSVCVGCAPKWNPDINVALRQARRREAGVVVFYKDPLDTRSALMRDALETSDVLQLLSDKVRCVMVPFYPPDQRFVARYGVMQPPALIVIHPDATYHALKDAVDADSVAAFLRQAKPPGARPELDAEITTPAKMQFYNVFERAGEAARKQNRRLIVVYKWWLDGDSSELIRRFTSPSVSSYFNDSVVCLLDWDYAPNRGIVADYGVTKYPAVVALDPDGAYRVLRGLPTVEQLIRLGVWRRPR